MTGDTSADAVLHTTFSGEYFCRLHHATFEPQEAERNDGDCPWCGNEVEGLA